MLKASIILHSTVETSFCNNFAGIRLDQWNIRTYLLGLIFLFTYFLSVFEAPEFLVFIKRIYGSLQIKCQFTYSVLRDGSNTFENVFKYFSKYFGKCVFKYISKYIKIHLANEGKIQILKYIFIISKYKIQILLKIHFLEKKALL